MHSSILCFITLKCGFLLLLSTMSTSFFASAFSSIGSVPRPRVLSFASIRHDDEEPDDTVRVRLWKALADGTERSLTELSVTLNETRSNIRFHLTHVEKQAKTLSSKSTEWRLRRSVPNSSMKLTLTKRIGRGKRHEVFYKIS